MKRTHLISILTILLFALVANLAVMAFVTRERTVYYWDWSGYWRRAQSTTDKVEGLLGIGSDATGVTPSERARRALPDEGNPDPVIIHGLERFARSIWSEDYNVLPVAPLLPWTIIFGAERLSYVLAVLNLYAIPAAILLCVFCSRYRLHPGALNNHWRIWVPLALIAGFPLFWAPIVRGMLDVVVLACNLLVLIIYFSRPLKELRWPALLAIGLLLTLSVILRRWNAYWAVSFLVIVGIDGLVGFARSQDRSAAHLFVHLRPSLIAGGAALAILLLGAGPLAFRMATTDYADIYDAYNREDGVLPVLAAVGGDLGYFWAVFFLGSAAALIWTREMRRLALFLTGQCVIIVGLFTSAQSFSVHHYYLLQAGILIVCSLCILVMLEHWSSAIGKGVVLGLMLAIALCVNLAVFVPRAAALREQFLPLVPRGTYHPLVRHDVEELNRLYAKLDELMHRPGASGHKFYVLSSTNELNNSHFSAGSIHPPFRFSSSDRLLRSHVVDKRDGFPQRLLKANVVVLGAPLGGWGDSSQVLLEPARLIKECIGLGRAFVELPYVFRLDNNVTARLFEKVRPFTTTEIQALSERLRRLYPDRPPVYEPDYDAR
jgi:hypothetical protein